MALIKDMAGQFPDNGRGSGETASNSSRSGYIFSDKSTLQSRVVPRGEPVTMRYETVSSPFSTVKDVRTSGSKASSHPAGFEGCGVMLTGTLRPVSLGFVRPF